MSIKKQEFYEGAALHILSRNGGIQSIKYEPPLFVVNKRILVLLKYSTRGRSPWGFTFTADEQKLLRRKSAKAEIIIGLVCGTDGVAAFSYEDYLAIAPHGKSSLHIACYRPHHKHYEVWGPEGPLNGKVPPSNWQRILD